MISEYHFVSTYICVSVYIYDVVGVDLTIEIMNLGLLILLTFNMYQNVGGDSFRLPPLK